MVGPAAAPQRPLASGLLAPRNVMVVEDDPILMLDLVSLLERPGHRVVARASRGEAAVAAFARLQVASIVPDLVLLDIHLGRGMNGIEAARQIRALDPDVAIAFRSAHGDAATRANAEGIGAIAFVDKSGPVEEMLRLVASVPPRSMPPATSA